MSVRVTNRSESARNATAATFRPPVRVKRAANTVSVSIASENSRRIRVGVRTVALTSAGGVRSSAVLLTEFCRPGVPPLGSVEAIQLSASEQGLVGLIFSSDQPPCAFTGSRYHASEHVSSSIGAGAGVAASSRTRSPVILSVGQLVTPMMRTAGPSSVR